MLQVFPHDISCVARETSSHLFGLGCLHFQSHFRSFMLKRLEFAHGQPLWLNNTRSSANSRSLSFFHMGNCKFLVVFSLYTCVVSQSSVTRKRRGLSRLPCCTLVFISNDLVILPSCNTLARKPSYRTWNILTILAAGIP